MSRDVKVPVVVLEHASPATRRVLRDAGCSFIDGSAHQWIRAANAIEVAPADARRIVEEMVRLVGAGEIDAAVLASNTLGGICGATEVVELSHPVELLEWLTRRRDAAAMHPGAKAYLYASDPDDILFKLPFHPKVEDDSPPPPVVERNGTLVAVATLVLSAGRLREVRFAEEQRLSGFESGDRRDVGDSLQASENGGYGSASR